MEADSEATASLSLAILDGLFFEVFSQDGEQIVATCQKCLPQNIKIKGTRNSTSNFLSHLKRKHGASAVEEYKEHLEVFKTANKKTKSQNTKPTQLNFTGNLVKFFSSSLIPLNAVEDENFISMLKGLNIQDYGINVPSRRSLCRLIANQYKFEAENVRGVLKEVKYVCTTTDVWSSRTRSFLGVTVHWIDYKTYERRSRAIACRRLCGVHSYDAIAEKLNSIHAQFDLNERKIVATVTDNGSNFVKAFKHFGVEMESLSTGNESGNQKNDEYAEIEMLEDSGVDKKDCDNDDELELHEEIDVPKNLPAHLRCAAHTLNLCATSDIKQIIENPPINGIHRRALAKCNQLWKCSQRPKTAEKIKQVLGHQLSKPGITRWNSLYDAIKQIISIEDKNAILFQELGKHYPRLSYKFILFIIIFLSSGLPDCISDVDFTYLKEFIKCSSPIAEALDILQGESFMYFGILMPCLMSLRKKLRRIEQSELKYCKKLATSYLLSVENRFEEYFDAKTPKGEFASIAALSYPRFKNKWFSCIDSQEQAIVICAVKHKMR